MHCSVHNIADVDRPRSVGHTNENEIFCYAKNEKCNSNRIGDRNKIGELVKVFSSTSMVMIGEQNVGPHITRFYIFRFLHENDEIRKNSIPYRCLSMAGVLMTVSRLIFNDSSVRYSCFTGSRRFFTVTAFSQPLKLSVSSDAFRTDTSDADVSILSRKCVETTSRALMLSSSPAIVPATISNYLFIAHAHGIQKRFIEQKKKQKAHGIDDYYHHFKLRTLCYFIDRTHKHTR